MCLINLFIGGLARCWISKVFSVSEPNTSRMAVLGRRHSTVALSQENIFWGDRYRQARVVAECNIQCAKRPFLAIYITFYRLQPNEYGC